MEIINSPSNLALKTDINDLPDTSRNVIQLTPVLKTRLKEWSQKLLRSPLNSPSPANRPRLHDPLPIKLADETPQRDSGCSGCRFKDWQIAKLQDEVRRLNEELQKLKQIKNMDTHSANRKTNEKLNRQSASRNVVKKANKRETVKPSDVLPPKATLTKIDKDEIPIDKEGTSIQENYSSFADIVKIKVPVEQTSQPTSKSKITPMPVETRKKLLHSFSHRFKKVYVYWERENISSVKSKLKRLGINVVFPLLSFIGANWLEIWTRANDYEKVYETLKDLNCLLPTKTIDKITSDKIALTKRYNFLSQKIKSNGAISSTLQQVLIQLNDDTHSYE
jgi:hypothetical protein